MHIQGRRRRIAFLREARRTLPQGAPLLCSFWVRQPTRYYAVVKRSANVARHIGRTERVELGDSLTFGYVHSFTRAEIAAELDAGGFRMTAFAAKPYGHAVAVAK